ncbi:MAG TPA: hypothetical protein VLF89_10045 [Candidatus Saccharimonadales bacterium]|nr:hypothetical protein [Candidatus Saccharimonadales bacterium]
MKKITNSIKKIYLGYEKNIAKILFILLLHFCVSSLVNLPYLNLINILIVFFPYLVDWVAFLILFRPQKELVLLVGICLFIPACIFAIIGFTAPLEISGDISYLLLATYIILSLTEIRKQKTPL